MSPILVRPVREQLEHDRVIRLLQVRWRRRYAVGINVGAEQVSPVGTGTSVVYPDLVLCSLERGHRLEAVVEVETGESVNNLEAMAQWAHFGKLKADFFLFVPAGSVDAARRLSADNGIPVSEIWTYHAIGDQMRFTPVYKAPPDSRPARRTVRRVPAEQPRRKAATTRSSKTVKRGAAKKATRKPARAQKRK